MPTLLKHHSQVAIKLLLAGDSGTGKTGALASLVEAGYKLRIQDFDNGLDILVNALRDKANAEQLLEAVSYATLTDKFRAVGGMMLPEGVPNAFSRAMNLLSHWKTEDEDLGPVTSWGENEVLVLDSMTFMASACYRWMDTLGVGKGKFGTEPRQIFFESQKKVGDCLSMLYSPSVKCNVVIISHLRYTDMPDGTKKGFPTSIGEAQGPQIPRFFNTFLQAKTLPGGKRVLTTQPTGLVDLKTPTLPGKVPLELPIETGLADYFKALRGVMK